jgi:hypothetical protein
VWFAKIRSEPEKDREALSDKAGTAISTGRSRGVVRAHSVRERRESLATGPLASAEQPSHAGKKFDKPPSRSRLSTRPVRVGGTRRALDQFVRQPLMVSLDVIDRHRPATNPADNAWRRFFMPI